MPTWGEILQELNTPPNTPDIIRRKYLQGLAKYTNRDVILYSTKWTDPTGVTPDLISITEEDIQDGKAFIKMSGRIMIQQPQPGTPPSSKNQNVPTVPLHVS